MKIKRNDKTVVLGLFRRVRPIHCNIAESACKDHSHDKHIDKYGYECGWNLTKLKQIAYRLQHIKYRLIPEFTRKLVSAYFCGVLRYSASILWCRSSDKNIKQARYYYCMAMSAALGLTAAESVGLSCCRNLSVKSNNTDYLKLLERTGLPSIEEMAMLDAC